MEPSQIDNMRRQLDALVAERNRLFEEIGVSDAESLIAMVRSLEAQLSDLYSSYGGISDENTNEALELLDRARKLAEDLGSGPSQREQR